MYNLESSSIAAKLSETRQNAMIADDEIDEDRLVGKHITAATAGDYAALFWPFTAWRDIQTKPITTFTTVASRPCIDRVSAGLSDIVDGDVGKCFAPCCSARV